MLNSLIVYARLFKKGSHFISPYETGPVRQTSLLFHASLISPWQHTSPCKRLPNWQCKTECTHPPIHPAPSLSLAQRRRLYSQLVYVYVPWWSFSSWYRVSCLSCKKHSVLCSLFQGLICWNSREVNCNRCCWPKAPEVEIESGVGAGSQCRRI